MPPRSLRVVLLCLSLAFGPFARAAAEPSPATPALTTATLDGATQSMAKIQLDASGKPEYLARFTDGPRRVARARGNAKERAERLGIGGHEAARRLLWTRPEPALLAEARGETPKKLLWPVVGGTWGRGFGYTRALRPELPHNGVDIGAKNGDVVRAVADGMVVYSDNGLLGFGNCVMILHPNGFLSLYAHTERTTVQPGWRVKRGERIALVGHTGYAWGPHLHFELRDNGRLRDPAPLFTGNRSTELNGPLVELEPDEGASAALAASGAAKPSKVGACPTCGPAGPISALMGKAKSSQFPPRVPPSAAKPAQPTAAKPSSPTTAKPAQLLASARRS
ncbi:MAG TPA: peptidoglycan DD-metalloendopeptidase family protein [Polyangiales bacterium]